MRILVIRLKQIGDALLSSPVCTNLKRLYPGATVDYLVYDHIAPLFLHHPDIDNVISITPEERSRKWLYLKKIWGLRRNQYDMVIDLHTTAVTVLTSRLTGAREQIGYDKGRWRSRLYKTRVPHPKTGGSLPAKLAVLNGLPVPAGDLVTDFRIYLTDDELKVMRKNLRGHGVDLARPVFVFSMISRNSEKNWPVEYFVEIIKKVLTAYSAQGILIWGPGEQDLVRSAARLIGPAHAVFCDIATPGLRDLAALLAVSVIFIGNDSGPRHVAEAVGTPTFTIFSPPIDKKSWVPHLGPLHRAVDLQDALRIDEAQWRARLPEFTRDIDRYYHTIKPDLVLDRLVPMLDTLLPAARRSVT